MTEYGNFNQSAENVVDGMFGPAIFYTMVY